MKQVFKELAGKGLDIVENMMDRVNPERIHLDCVGNYGASQRRHGQGRGGLFAVGTIGSNSWNIHWADNGSNLATPDNQFETSLTTIQMMEVMDNANRRRLPSAATKSPDHYDSWRERNVRRLAKQGIKPSPASVA